MALGFALHFPGAFSYTDEQDAQQDHHNEGDHEICASSNSMSWLFI